MKILPSELPYEQFELIGIKKEDFRAFPQATYQALLSGNRTSLMRFYFKDPKGEKVQLDAKLSLQRNEAGMPVLFYHPVQKELKNNFNLSEKDFNTLKNNQSYFIEQTIANKEGKKINTLITIDRTTNELVAINKDALQPPVMANGIALTKEQQLDFLTGKTIEVNGAKFNLNPNNEVGMDARHTKFVTTRNARIDLDHLLFDVTLIATGLGGFVLLEHLLNFAHRHKIVENKEQLLKNEAVRNALAKAAEEFRHQKEAHATTGKNMNDLQAEYELSKSIHQQLLMLPDTLQQEMKLLPESQKFLAYQEPDENNMKMENEEESFSQQNEQKEDHSNSLKFKR